MLFGALPPDSSRDGTVYFVAFDSQDPSSSDFTRLSESISNNDRVTIALTSVATDNSLTHGGGIAASGQYVLIPFEEDNSVSPKTKSEIVAFDVSVNPPAEKWHWTRTSEATAIGAVKTSNNGVHVNSTVSVRNRQVLAVWEINNDTVRDYQNISLLAQHEGQLYLVGSNTADSTGEEIIDMWQSA